ncbi:MAG: ABC transporter permease subunit [bacterium]|nr:ABC transporter permease subunit [bacterium]
MFKREMRINLKSFIIWTSILIILFLIVFLIYPSIINNENIKLIDEMMQLFPKEMLKSFNMDISSIDSAFGWVKTEGFIFILLITGIYSGILGSSILSKEENDKTVEYLSSLPIKRSSIVINKMLVGIIYIFLMIIILGIFNYIGLSLSGNFDKKLYLILSITPLLSSIVIFNLCLYLSTYSHKTNKTLVLSLGLVFISYFLQILSELSNETEVLKYFSIFTLTDIRNIIITGTINPIMIIISLIISVGLGVATVIHYNNKELI